MCQHLLWPNISSCGLQELRVGGGDDYYNYHNNNIFHVLTDTKFRKGFHQDQALLPLQALQEEDEIDNIFDIDICVIEAEAKEEGTTTTPTATTST